MTSTQSLAPRAETAPGRRFTAWPLAVAAAGVLGAAATLFTDLLPPSWVGEEINADVVADVSRGLAHASVVLGFLTVAALLILSASWRRQVEPRVAASTAARVVTHGLVASAGALMIGYGYKGMLAVYLPGGLNEDGYDQQALYIMYVLNDFGSFVGWLGVTVAAGALAWMALKERTVSRWIGVVSLLPVLAVLGMAGATGLPGFQGVVSPAWLVVASLGLVFGRSPITR